MDALSLHYSQLLGLGSAWLVDDVDLSLQDQRVVIRLRHDSSVPVTCPECGQACKLHDHAPERRWRHLDTMQFETVLSARVPRSKCLECGVKTIAVPWASPHSRFTLKAGNRHPHSSLQETKHQRNHPRSTESFRFCLSATD